MLNASITLSIPGVGYDYASAPSMIKPLGNGGGVQIGELNTGTVEVRYRFDIPRLGNVTDIDIALRGRELAWWGGTDVQVGSDTWTITGTDLDLTSASSAQANSWVDGQSDSDVITDYVDVTLVNSGVDNLELQRIDVEITYENVEQFHLETFQALYAAYQKFDRYDDSSGDYLREFGDNAGTRALLENSVYWLQFSAEMLIGAGGTQLVGVYFPPGSAYAAAATAATAGYSSCSTTISLLNLGIQIQDLNTYTLFPVLSQGNAQDEIDDLCSSSHDAPDVMQNLAQSWHSKVKDGTLSDTEAGTFQGELSNASGEIQTFSDRIGDYVGRVNEYSQASSSVKSYLFRLVTSLGGYAWNNDQGSVAPNGATYPSAMADYLLDISEKIAVEEPPDPYNPEPGDLNLEATASAYVTNHLPNDTFDGSLPFGQGDHAYDSYLKFDLSDIPLGSTIQSASLSVYVLAAQGTPPYFAPFACDESWGAVTWNTKPDSSQIDFVPYKFAHSVGWYTFGVGAWVQDCVNLLDDNYGIHFWAEGGLVTIGSRYGQYAPVLAVNYTTPTGRPDLVSQNVSADGQSNVTAMPGDQIEIDFDVLNQGNAPAERSDAAIVWSTNSSMTSTDYILRTEGQRALAAGDVDDESEAVTIPQDVVVGRTYFIGVIADYDDMIDEQDEANNAGSSYVSVTIADGVAPTGSVSIVGTEEFDGDVNTLDSPRLRIDPSAFDDSGTVESMRLSFDGTNWNNWEPYSQNAFDVTLSRDVIGSANGQVSLYIQYRDPSGNVSSSYSDSIAITATPPTVNNLTDIVAADGSLSFREALLIAALHTGETLTFDTALFASGPAVITLGGSELAIAADTVIQGPGTELLTIDADGQSRVFRVDSNVQASIHGLTITGGFAADADGGGIINLGELNIVESTISGNSASANGGGIYSLGLLTLNNATVSANSADSEGGGIYSFNPSGTVAFENSTIDGNTAERSGGGIYFAAGSTARVEASRITGNTVWAWNVHGGGISSVDTSLVVIDCEITGNSSESEFSPGGGLHVSGSTQITNTLISRNSAIEGGAGVYCVGNTTIVDSTISENWAWNSSGAGILNYGSLTIAGSSIVSNANEGMNDSTGGGIANRGVLYAANCVIAGNSAPYGGGVDNSGTAVLANVTATQNVAFFGGGIWSPGTLQLNNTIVAGNTANTGADIDAPGTAAGSHSLIGDGSGQSTFLDGVDGNLVGTASAPIDPRLSELTVLPNGFWGYFLMSDSPALDAGENSLAIDVDGNPLTMDLAANARIENGTVDIGAVEGASAGSTGNTYVIQSLDNAVAADGVLTFREAFDAANTNLPVGDAPAGSFSERDVLQFAEGLVGAVELGGAALAIAGRMTIDGPGSELLRFDANGQSRVFEISAAADVVLAGITIADGYSLRTGGGVFADGTCLLDSVVISDNSTHWGDGAGMRAGLMPVSVIGSQFRANSTYLFGGGIFALRSVLVSQSTFSGNNAIYGGGIFVRGDNAQISDCTFVQNSANYGGAIFSGFEKYVESTLSISDSVFQQNSADYGGGVYVDYSGSLTITDSTLSGNSAAEEGGGVHSDGMLTIGGTDLEGNSAGLFGGGISSYGDTTISQSNILGNQSWDAGGIYNANEMELRDSTVSGNIAEDDGGAIRNEGNLLVENVVISDNTAARWGGGLYITGGVVELVDSELWGNSGAEGGGAWNSATLEITRTDVSRNTATGSGGGVYNSGTLEVESSTFATNQATVFGGGIANHGDCWLVSSTLLDNWSHNGGGIYSSLALAVTDSTLSGNVGDYYGGAIYSNDAVLTVSNSMLSGNEAQWGGACYIYGDASISDSQFTGNHAIVSGGGIYGSSGALSLDGSTLSSNWADNHGGGLYVAFGSLNVTSSFLSGNHAGRHGGGIYLDSCVATIDDSVFEDNQAPAGGGIYIFYSTTNVNNSDFVGNQATRDAGGGVFNCNGTLVASGVAMLGNQADDHGGAIYSLGPATVVASTISANSAGDDGGGIFSHGTLIVTGSLLSANSAENGGGIYNYQGSLHVVGSTVAGNQADYDGGGVFGYDIEYLHNTIVAQNMAASGPDVSGPHIFGSYSLIGRGPNELFLPDGSDGHRIDTDPFFVSVQTYTDIVGPDGQYGTSDDGPLGDYRLLEGSQAVDAGSNSYLDETNLGVDLDGSGTIGDYAITTDLDGSPRPQGMVVDLGAYESPFSVIWVGTLADGPANWSDGTVTLRDALAWAADASSPGTQDIMFACWLELDTTPGEIELTEGQLMIDSDVRIVGPGTSQLTIDADADDDGMGESRVFFVDTVAAATIQSLTITGGYAQYDGSDWATREGGGIHNRGTLIVRNSTVSGCATETYWHAGGLYNVGTLIIADSLISANEGNGFKSSGNATILRCTISQNTGGGISNNGTLVVESSTVSGNHGEYGGIFNGGTLTVTSSSVSGNQSEDVGGGIYNYGDLTVRNTTIADNQAQWGGGIYSDSDASGNKAWIVNSTIVGNTASTGGGIAYNSNEDGYLVLQNTIVADNSAIGEPDVFLMFPEQFLFEAAFCLIGVWTSEDIALESSNLSGTSEIPLDPGLTAITDQDGTLLYYRPMIGSPAVDSGNNSLALDAAGGPLAFDQLGLIRSTDFQSDDAAAVVDMGAVELQNSVELAVTTTPKVEILEGQSVLVDVSLTAEPADVVTVNIARTPGGSPNIDADTLTLTFEPGNWSTPQTLTLSALDDLDRDNDTAAFSLSAIGLDTVRIFVTGIDDDYQTYVVNSLADEVMDDGYLTLREALEAANTNTALFAESPEGCEGLADRITFDPSLFVSGGLTTLTLDGSELVISDSVQIVGPGRELFVIDANGRSRVFRVTPDYYQQESSEIAHLTITGGLIADPYENGGGILNEGVLALESVAVVGNAASSGGGIYSGQDAVLQVTASLLADNSAQAGGGLYAEWSGRATVVDSDIVRNVADVAGGIFSFSYLEIVGSAISENSANAGGGLYTLGLFFEQSVSMSTVSENIAEVGAGIFSMGDLAVTECSIFGNVAAGQGGGIYAADYYGNLSLTNVTLAGNAAAEGGGIYDVADDLGSVTLNNAIVGLNRGGDITGRFKGSNYLIGVDPGFVRAPSAGPDGQWGTADDDLGDLHLASTSAAVDAGDDAIAVDAGDPLTVDLDGNPRIAGAAVDIGAYEYQGTPALGREIPSAVVTSAADVFDLYDNETTLREAIWYVSQRLASTSTITFDPLLGGSTITLSGYELLVYESLAIDASALSSLTVNADTDGNPATVESRVFSIVDTDDPNGDPTDVALTSLTITGGQANRGGGILNTHARLTIADSILSGNSADTDGGGVFSNGALTLTASTLAENSAGRDGGGGYNAGSATIIGCTVRDNTATGSGGGAMSRSDDWEVPAGLTVVNTLAYGNSADGDGGGIYLDNTEARFVNNTLANNAAGLSGGGIYTNQSTLYAYNNAIALNTSTVASHSSDAYGTLTNTLNVDYCLIGLVDSFSLNIPEASNLFGSEASPITPLFGDPLAEDFRLLTGSPMIDAGSNVYLDEIDSDGDGPDWELDLDGSGTIGDFAITTDFANRSRIIGFTVDIGAYESSPAYADLIGRVSNTGDWYVAKSDGASFTSERWGRWSPNVDWVDVHIGDFTGDGKDDVVGRTPSGDWYVARSDGTAFTMEHWGRWSPNVNWVDVQIGDFDGDGKDDLVGRVGTTGDWWVAKSNGDSFSTTHWDRWSPNVSWDNIRVGDFNGDGKDDLVGRVSTTGDWWVATSTGDSFSATRWDRWSPNVSWDNIQVGDFTGDGKDDLVGRVSTTGDWWVATSTGDSFSATLWDRWSPDLSWDNIQVGDFTGDGKDDLVGRVSTTGDWWVAASTGDSFAATRWDRWSPNLSWDNIQVGDFTGDGKDDLVGRVSTTGDWWVASSNGTAFTSSRWGRWSPNVDWMDVQVGNFDGAGSDANFAAKSELLGAAAAADQFWSDLGDEDEDSLVLESVLVDLLKMEE